LTIIVRLVAPERALGTRLEIAKEGLLAAELTGDPFGALWAVSGGTKTELAPGTLLVPGGVAVGHNGTLSVTTGTFFGMAYPAGGPYYQDLSAFIPTFNRNLPIAYRLRCTDCGGREVESVSDAYRFLAGLEGTLFGKYDWKLGVSTAGNDADSTLGNGYMFTAPLTAALASGFYNPWRLPGQAQDPRGAALLDAARANGTKLFGGEATLKQFDGSITGEIMQLPAGPLAFAAGFDYRKESYKFADGSTATQPVYQAAFDAEFPKVERTVKAIYAELAVPLHQTLEATVAVRHDDYSDFGGTTNPKLTLRYQPWREMMIRGAYGSGFRAPTLSDLFLPNTRGLVDFIDPLRCPTTELPTDCEFKR